MDQLHSMSVEDKRQLLQQLACDPESKAYMEELVSRENTLVSPPNYGGSDTLTGSDCMQGCVPQFNLSHEQFSMSHDVSGFQGGVASQPEDELLSSKTPSMVLESLPPSFQHQSSISTNISTKTDPEASLPTQQTNTASLSTSGIGSDLSTLDGPLVMKQMSNTSTASHGGECSVYVLVCVNTHTIYTRILVHTHTYTHAHTCTPEHFVHTHTHTHAHTHTPHTHT